MAYDERLAERVKPLVMMRPGFSEKKMFGGLAWLLNGNMCVGIHKDRLIFRLGKEDGAAALSEPHVGPMDITGRPMKGWVMVRQEGLEESADIQRWVERAIAFVETLPAK